VTKTRSALVEMEASKQSVCNSGHSGIFMRCRGVFAGLVRLQAVATIPASYLQIERMP